MKVKMGSPSFPLAPMRELTPGVVVFPCTLTWFLMSSHFSSDVLCGFADHFFRKGSVCAPPGNKARSSSAPASPAKQS